VEFPVQYTTQKIVMSDIIYLRQDISDHGLMIMLTYSGKLTNDLTVVKFQIL
jgi:hypothetical protein